MLDQSRKKHISVDPDGGLPNQPPAVLPVHQGSDRTVLLGNIFGGRQLTIPGS